MCTVYECCASLEMLSSCEQDKGKLLDFDFEDEDIASLRK